MSEIKVDVGNIPADIIAEGEDHVVGPGTGLQ